MREEILYMIKTAWFYSGREAAMMLAKTWGRVIGESPGVVLEMARKVKL